MQVTSEEGSSGILKFLLISALIAPCSLLPTVMGYVWTKTSIQMIWDSEIGFQRFLKAVIYIWLLALAIVPLLIRPVSITRILLIFVLFYFSLRIPRLVESQSLYPIVPINVLSILGPAAIFAATFIFAKLLPWHENQTASINELSPAPQPVSIKFRTYAYATILPVLLLSVIPATIALLAFLIHPLMAFYLMIPGSALYNYWQFGFVALLGISLASYQNLWNWMIYFALVCAIVPIVTYFSTLKYPEGKLIVFSYLLISVLILLWLYFFSRWVRTEARMV